MTQVLFSSRSRGFIRLSGVLIMSLLLSSCGSNFDAEKECWNPELLQVQFGEDIYEFPYDVRVNLDAEAEKKRKPLTNVITRDDWSYSFNCQPPNEAPLKTDKLSLYWDKRSNIDLNGLSRGSLKLRQVDFDKNYNTSISKQRLLIPKNVDFSKFIFLRHYTIDEGFPEKIIFKYDGDEVEGELKMHCHSVWRDNLLQLHGCRSHYQMLPDLHLSYQISPYDIPPETWPQYWDTMYDALQSYKVKSTKVSE